MVGGRLTGTGLARRTVGRRRTPGLAALAGLAMAVTGGCLTRPSLTTADRQRPVDRNLVEYPADFTLVPVVTGLNQPTAICFDKDRGDLLVAESGIDGSEPHIFGYHLSSGQSFPIYPFTRTVSFFPTGYVIHGPIGGLLAHDGRVYVSHRDRDGFGVITAFGYDGTHTTIVARLPAQGDYGVTDLAIHNRRLFFGIGTATNSGVVGLDNWDQGWAKQYPDVCDRLYSPAMPPVPIKGTGSRLDCPNPRAGLFQSEILVTTAFQPLGHGNQSRITPVAVPNGAIVSVALDGGGDVQVEATGLHNPRGLATDEFDRLFATNDGMQLRGTRPVANDPDVLLNVTRGLNGQWPDRTTDGHSVTDPLYAPPLSFLYPHGYSELTNLIDNGASGIPPFVPSDFDARVAGVFPSLSGAAKVAFVPQAGPFAARFGGMALVALDGDRAPFASGGLKLKGFVGGQVDLVDIDAKQVHDFVYNTARVPASRQPFGTAALERPVDVKFTPDGSALYILDFGQMENDSAVPRYHNGTGAIYKLVPVKK